MKLTDEQIEARMEAWEEAAGHAEAVSWEADNPIEKEQLKWVAAKIRAMAESWYLKTRSTR